MIKTLLLFILSCIRFSLDILRIAIIKAFLPRMPLHNWTKEVQVDDAGRGEDSRLIKLWNRASTSDSPDRTLFATADEETARFKIPKSFTEHTVPADKVDVNIITPTKSAAAAVVGFEFSIYPDSDSTPPPTPRNIRHPYLTPVRRPIREVGLTILRNASDRVTEILRENRRRLDAGEDPNTIRREARRKRAMELSAVRKGRAKPFSLV